MDLYGVQDTKLHIMRYPMPLPIVRPALICKADIKQISLFIVSVYSHYHYKVTVTLFIQSYPVKRVIGIDGR